MNLELLRNFALKFQDAPPTNAARFCWWGASELGSLRSSPIPLTRNLHGFMSVVTNVIRYK